MTDLGTEKAVAPDATIAAADKGAPPTEEEGCIHGKAAHEGCEGAAAPAEVAAEPRTPHVARLVGLNLLPDGDDLLSFSPDSVVVSLHEPEGSTRLRWHGPIATLAPHGDAAQ